MPAMPRIEDSQEARARARLLAWFVDNPESVFYSRQLEVLFEREFFHWVTNRALRALVEEGKVATETRLLDIGSEIKLVWNRSFRFYKRAAASVHDLVNRYSTAASDGTLGMQGEHLVLAAFARRQYVLKGEGVASYQGRVWEESNHNLDFIFEKEGVAYGIEVKNTLGYIDIEEFALKVRLALFLGVRPLFAVRALPATWIGVLSKVGGYAMVMGYQFYPWTHKELAVEIREKLRLQVDMPKKIESGTMERFENRMQSARGSGMETDPRKVEKLLEKILPDWVER